MLYAIDRIADSQAVSGTVRLPHTHTQQYSQHVQIAVADEGRSLAATDIAAFAA